MRIWKLWECKGAHRFRKPLTAWKERIGLSRGAFWFGPFLNKLAKKGPTVRAALLDFHAVSAPGVDGPVSDIRVICPIRD
jgi:hypothetical protein